MRLQYELVNEEVHERMTRQLAQSTSNAQMAASARSYAAPARLAFSLQLLVARLVALATLTRSFVLFLLNYARSKGFITTQLFEGK